MATSTVTRTTEIEKKPGQDAEVRERTDERLSENSKENLDEKLDNAVDETFPGSDPVSVKITK